MAGAITLIFGNRSVSLAVTIFVQIHEQYLPLGEMCKILYNKIRKIALYTKKEFCII